MRAGQAVTRLLGVVKDDKAGLEREGTLSRLGKERQWFGVLGGDGMNSHSVWVPLGRGSLRAPPWNAGGALPGNSDPWGREGVVSSAFRATCFPGFVLTPGPTIHFLRYCCCL